MPSFIHIIISIFCSKLLQQIKKALFRLTTAYYQKFASAPRTYKLSSILVILLVDHKMLELSLSNRTLFKKIGFSDPNFTVLLR